MRPTREQAKENRQRILDTAARLFRENGIHAVGVDAVMKGAGLTHGGFYGHFKSKSDLTAEAVSYAMETSLQSPDDIKSMDDFATIYLSKEHRDAAGDGCAVATLGPELARLPAGQRGTVSDYIRARIAQVEALQAATDGTIDRRKAIADLSSLVGALIMARTVDDPKLSDEILTETARFFAGDGAKRTDS
jgi:TetR/AcrR family transcriptional regulator, transcriptional repressor for nem operon